VVSDFRSKRIPNWVAGSILLIGALFQCATSGWGGLPMAASGAVVALAFFLPLYVRKAMGAGDVKLMAALCAWLGPVAGILACAVTLVAGLVLAAIALVCSSSSARRPGLIAAGNAIHPRVRASLAVERDGRIKVPYAGAIAAGSVAGALYLDRLAPVLGPVN
jgi:prepilin peptidase CpaA